MRPSLFLAFCLFSAPGIAQVPQLISPEQALQQLATPAVAAMPPIAAAAHVYGEVKVQIVIDLQGHPTRLTVLSGQPMLVGTAIESIRQSSYRPFLVDDKPAPVTTVVSLVYGEKTPLRRGEKPEPLLPDFYQAQSDCKKALQDKSKPEKQIKPCAQAAKLAESFAAVDFFVYTIESAFINASAAFLNNKQFDQAIAFADKVLARTALGFGDASTPCTAYVARANAELSSNDGVSADIDLNKAESAERSAILWIQDDRLKQAYQHILKNILEFHAKVLSVAGNQAGAQEKMREAATL
jgi:hypothetical protein